MEAMSGTDTAAYLEVGRGDEEQKLLGGIRRLPPKAASASDRETIFRALARELLRSPGAEEVHVHHLAARGEEREDVVVVYPLAAEGRLSYLVPRPERPAGVSWVAS